MRILRQYPATLILIIINAVVFAYLRMRIGTFADPFWTQGLLFRGADFAPLALDTEWYRMFTHLFMHGNIPHLAFNMYALFAVGSEVEKAFGTKKFLFTYFLCGLVASLTSMYFNLFTIGVGASGCIFGVFGFSLVKQISDNRKERSSIVAIVVNFAIFIVINLLFASALKADNAAHFGGLLCGAALGVAALIPLLRNTFFVEAVATAAIVVVFMVFPRYQVTYFNCFQQVLTTDDEYSNALKQNISDEEFRQKMVQVSAGWDTARIMLEAHTWLPKELKSDTFKVGKYINLRQQEADYRISMVDRQTFRYLDSIDMVKEEIPEYTKLDFPLTMMRPIREQPRDTIPPNNFRRVQVWYNDEWEELPGPPGKYYRVGQRDSVGRWQGPAWDFYSNGKVQMKGTYLNSKRDGIFLYYSNHNTYTSAGRYENDEPVGKWEAFHDNGRLKSEEFYTDRYRMRNAWDEEGNLMVTDGEGTYREYYSNGVVAVEGEYRDGRRMGLWTGRHDDGSMYFEELFHDGRLIRGRAVTRSGETFLYDASSLFAMPEGGNERLLAYLNKSVAALNPDVHGKVRISFRVTINRVLTDFVVDESLNPELDAKAIELIKAGPPWLPARDHGHLPRSGWGWVTVQF